MSNNLTLQEAVQRAACRLSDGVTEQQEFLKASDGVMTELSGENKNRLYDYKHLKEAVDIVKGWDDE